MFELDNVKNEAILGDFFIFQIWQHQKRRKNTQFRDFPTFSRTCIFFLLTLSLLWSSLFCSSLFYSSLLSDSSHLCFSSVHIVGNLTSKLPSIISKDWPCCWAWHGKPARNPSTGSVQEKVATSVATGASSARPSAMRCWMTFWHSSSHSTSGDCDWNPRFSNTTHNSDLGVVLDLHKPNFATNGIEW